MRVDAGLHSITHTTYTETYAETTKKKFSRPKNY